jgi:hypothetical protein
MLINLLDNKESEETKIKDEENIVKQNGLEDDTSEVENGVVNPIGYSKESS